MAYPTGYWAELVRSSSRTQLRPSASGTYLWLRTSDGNPLEQEFYTPGTDTWAGTTQDFGEPDFIGYQVDANNRLRVRKAGEAWVPGDDGTLAFQDIPWYGGTTYRFFRQTKYDFEITVDSVLNPETTGSIIISTDITLPNRATVAYQWSLLHGPGRVVPFRQNALYAITNVRVTTDIQVQAVATVTLSDGTRETETAVVDFKITPVFNPPRPIINTRPHTVNRGDVVRLQASDSDLGGSVVRRQWTATGGAFANAAVQDAVWTAPEPVDETDYVLTYTVTDDDGQQASATVTITVRGGPVPKEAAEAKARVGRPLVKYPAHGRKVGPIAGVSRPIAKARPIPKRAEAKAKAGRPLVKVKAIGRRITAFARVSQPRAGQRMLARAGVGRPIAKVKAIGRRITTLARVGRPIVKVKALGKERAPARAGARQVHAYNKVTPADPDHQYHVQTRQLDGDEPVYALEINHKLLPEPIRVVAANKAIFLDGDTYNPLGFNAVPPQFMEGETPTASLEIDNVGQKIMEWVEKSDGGRGAVMRVMRAVRPPPRTGSDSHIVWEMPRMTIGVTAADMQKIRVTVLQRTGRVRPAVKMRFDRSTAPGLF